MAGLADMPKAPRPAGARRLAREARRAHLRSRLRDEIAEAARTCRERGYGRLAAADIAAACADLAADWLRKVG